MRHVLLTLLVVALALPAAAVADRATATGGAAASSAAGRDGTKAKQRTAKLKRAKARAAKARKAKAKAKAERLRLRAQNRASGPSSAGSVDELEVTGPIASLDPLTVGALSCVVPVGMSLSGLAVGDVVEMTCDLVDGQWTLRSLESEDAGHEDVDDELEVEGPIVSLDPLTVGASSCVVPVGMSLSGLAVGDVVEMTCDLVDGQWTLRSLESEDDGHASGSDDDDEHDHAGSGHDDDAGHDD